MRQDILVLGAGMVGTCAALELALRGHAVTLVDRAPPGRETSYGNAGIIQREAVEPYAFPRDLASLLSAALGRGLNVHYQLGGLLAAAPHLLRYWRNSALATYAPIALQYSRLIAHADTEHARLIEAAGAEDLLRRTGLRFVFRSEAALDAALAEARRLEQQYSVLHTAQDGKALAAAEPALRLPLAGAVHWRQSWSVSEPGALVERYAALLQRLGGRLLRGDAASLRPQAGGWQVATDEGPVQTRHAVLALGPWADQATRRLGYGLPLFVKRGYHRHYRDGASPNVPLLDAERGYVMSPMRQGTRITTGAEIAGIDAPATSRQMDGVEAQARQLIALGSPVESQPWRGARPCTADMKPVIGAAPRHPGLWFDFGHGHQGFTLGPASARLLADLLEGNTPYTDAAPFSPLRFQSCRAAG